MYNIAIIRPVQSARTFSLQWVIANSVGMTLGFPLGLASGVVVGSLVRSISDGVYFAVLLAVSGAIIGASFGSLQWLVLQQHLSQAGRWVLASTLGLSLSFLVGISMNEEGGLAVAAGSAALLLTYWIVLRRRIASAGLWALTGTVKLAIGLFVASGVFDFMLDSIGPSGYAAALSSTLGDVMGELAVAGMIGGAASGMSSAIPTLWLMRRAGSTRANGQKTSRTGIYG